MWRRVRATWLLFVTIAHAGCCRTTTLPEAEGSCPPKYQSSGDERLPRSGGLTGFACESHVLSCQFAQPTGHHRDYVIYITIRNSRGLARVKGNGEVCADRGTCVTGVAVSVSVHARFPDALQPGSPADRHPGADRGGRRRARGRPAVRAGRRAAGPDRPAREPAGLSAREPARP